MIALLATLAVLAAIALPAFAAGVKVGRGQRRARGAMMPPPRRRASAREVIAEACRSPPRRLTPMFGDTPAGQFERGEP